MGGCFSQAAQKQELLQAIQDGDMASTSLLVQTSPQLLCAPLDAAGNLSVHMAVLSRSTHLLDELLLGMDQGTGLPSPTRQRCAEVPGGDDLSSAAL